MKLTNSNREFTQTDIDNYLAGKLSHEERHEIEAQSLDDPFLADALEGYSAFPNEIKSVPAFRSKKQWVWILSSFALLLLIGLLFFLNYQPNNKILVSNSIINLKQDSYEKTVLKSPFVKENNEKEIVIPTAPISEQNKVTNKKEIKLMPLVREIVSLETYQQEPEIYSQETNYDLAKVKIKTIAFYNFIAVDYSVIYIDNQEFEEIDMGTPASQANASTTFSLTDEMMLTKTKKYTYKEYLKKSLKDLSTQSYKSAINKFELILEHYPQDVNAQFYSGFALFNQGKFTEAISFFDQATQNSFDFFYEDAEWYKGLCLEASGKTVEAKKLFKKIYQARGFYASQAFRKI